MPLAEVTGQGPTPAQAGSGRAAKASSCAALGTARLALAVDDARAVHERAVEFAEAARLRNQAKVTERLAATQASIIKGKPLPEGLKDVDALSLMKAGERDERLEKLDSMYEEFASGYAVYHPIRDED